MSFEELEPPHVERVLMEALKDAERPKVSATVVAAPDHLRAMRALADAVESILMALQTCAARWKPESDQWVQASAGSAFVYDMGLRVEQALMLVLDHTRRPADTPFSPGAPYELGALVLQRGPRELPGAELIAMPGRQLGISLIMGQPSTRKGILRSVVHLTPAGICTNFWAVSGADVIPAAVRNRFPPSSWIPPGRVAAVNLPNLSHQLRKLPAYIAA